MGKNGALNTNVAAFVLLILVIKVEILILCAFAAIVLIIFLSQPQANDQSNNVRLHRNLKGLILNLLDTIDSHSGQLSPRTVDVAVQCDSPSYPPQETPVVSVDTEGLSTCEDDDLLSDWKHINEEQKEIENRFSDDDDDDDDDDRFLMESLQISSRNKSLEDKLIEKILQNGDTKQYNVQNVGHMQQLQWSDEETTPKCDSSSSVSLEQDHAYLSFTASNDEDASLSPDRLQYSISLVSDHRLDLTSEDRSMLVSLHSSLVSHIISPSESPPENGNRENFSHILDAYYAIYNNLHAMTFITGCLISNNCLDVLIKNHYDLKDCYQQVINVIPLNVEHHLVNVRYASEAVPELSVTEVDVARGQGR